MAVYSLGHYYYYYDNCPAIFIPINLPLLISIITALLLIHLSVTTSRLSVVQSGFKSRCLMAQLVTALLYDHRFPSALAVADTVPISKAINSNILIIVFPATELFKQQQQQQQKENQSRE